MYVKIVEYNIHNDTIRWPNLYLYKSHIMYIELVLTVFRI